MENTTFGITIKNMTLSITIENTILITTIKNRTLIIKTINIKKLSTTTISITIKK